MITRERRVELVARMSKLVKGGEYPDNAFEKVADDAGVSGKDRKALKKTWKSSYFYNEWVRSHSAEAQGLVW